MFEPVIVEQTAKRWKAIQAGGVAGMLCGLLSLALGWYVLAGVLLVWGLGAYIYSRVGRWWNHG